MFGEEFQGTPLRQVVVGLAEAAPLIAAEPVAGAGVDVTSTFGCAARIASTSVIGIEASVSPKCICTGQFGRSSLVPAMPPPYQQDDAAKLRLRVAPHQATVPPKQ